MSCYALNFTRRCTIKYSDKKTIITHNVSPRLASASSNHINHFIKHRCRTYNYRHHDQTAQSPSLYCHIACLTQLTELQAAGDLWSTENNTEFQFNTDWRGDNKNTTQHKTHTHTHTHTRTHTHTHTHSLSLSLSLSLSYTHTHRGKKKDYSVGVKGWQNMQRVNLSARFVTTSWQRVRDDKTCRQCIKFDTFCHLGDKMCRGGKMCRNRAILASYIRAQFTKDIFSVHDLVGDVRKHTNASYCLLKQTLQRLVLL